MHQPCPSRPRHGRVARRKDELVNEYDIVKWTGSTEKQRKNRWGGYRGAIDDCEDYSILWSVSDKCVWGYIIKAKQPNCLLIKLLQKN